MSTYVIMFAQNVTHSQLNLPHGSENWKIMNSLDFVVMRFLMKLFCTSNTDIVNDCRMYCGFKLPSEIIPTRTNKFTSKLSNVVNSC